LDTLITTLIEIGSIGQFGVNINDSIAKFAASTLLAENLAVDPSIT
jgi:hypothetical protein